MKQTFKKTKSLTELELWVDEAQATGRVHFVAVVSYDDQLIARLKEGVIGDPTVGGITTIFPDEMFSTLTWAESPEFPSEETIVQSSTLWYVLFETENTPTTLLDQFSPRVGNGPIQ